MLSVSCQATLYVQCGEGLHLVTDPTVLDNKGCCPEMNARLRLVLAYDQTIFILSGKLVFRHGMYQCADVLHLRCICAVLQLHARQLAQSVDIATRSQDTGATLYVCHTLYWALPHAEPAVYTTSACRKPHAVENPMPYFGGPQRIATKTFPTVSIA